MEAPTAEQVANLQAEIAKRKQETIDALERGEDAADTLVNGFWQTRTKTEIMSYQNPESTMLYTYSLPEFRRYLQELMDMAWHRVRANSTGSSSAMMAIAKVKNDEPTAYVPE